MWLTPVIVGIVCAVRKKYGRHFFLSLVVCLVIIRATHWQRQDWKSVVWGTNTAEAMPTSPEYLIYFMPSHTNIQKPGTFLKAPTCVCAEESVIWKVWRNAFTVHVKWSPLDSICFPQLIPWKCAVFLQLCRSFYIVERRNVFARRFVQIVAASKSIKSWVWVQLHRTASGGQCTVV